MVTSLCLLTDPQIKPYVLTYPTLLICLRAISRKFILGKKGLCVYWGICCKLVRVVWRS